MRKYELLTNYTLSTVAICGNRNEQLRYVRILREWTKANPKATVEQHAIFESWVMLHLREQRLYDARVLADGSPTTYKKNSAHEYSLEAEDVEQKQRELKSWLPLLAKTKLDLLRLAMANDISLQISGDAGSVQNLFAARDKLLEKPTCDAKCHTDKT